MFNYIKNLFSRSDTKKNKSANEISGDDYDQISQRVHSRMDSGMRLNEIIADIDSERDDGLASTLAPLFEDQYEQFFGSLNNVNPRLDRESIELLATLGVNFNARSNFNDEDDEGKTAWEILKAIIDHPSTSPEGRENARADIAFLRSVVDGTSMAEVAPGEVEND